MRFKSEGQSLHLLGADLIYMLFGYFVTVSPSLRNRKNAEAILRIRQFGEIKNNLFHC